MFISFSPGFSPVKTLAIDLRTVLTVCADSQTREKQLALFPEV
jgi:hypothetical protein